jgi:peptidylprolyl isomerase
MGEIIKIDDERITEADFITRLKLTDEYTQLLEQMIRSKVGVHAAKKRGITIEDKELQNAANAFRMTQGLQRAKDTHDWMQRMSISVNDLEQFLAEEIYMAKIRTVVTSEEEINAYFKLNSPKFDTVDVHHIVADSQDKANEIAALLEEDPDSFDEIAEEFKADASGFESSESLKGIRRDALSDEISAKLFNAAIGDVVGPFHMGMEDYYEVLMVTGIHPAVLDDSVRTQVSEAIFEEWLQSRLQEHSIQ